MVIKQFLATTYFPLHQFGKGGFHLKPPNREIGCLASRLYVKNFKCLSFEQVAPHTVTQHFWKNYRHGFGWRYKGMPKAGQYCLPAGNALHQSIVPLGFEPLRRCLC